MRERPILFTGPMVRAILAGTKTQTRRALNPQPKFGFKPWLDDNGEWMQSGYGEAGDDFLRIPIAAGDRLWVREAWRTQAAFDGMSPSEIVSDFEDEFGTPSIPTFYEADRCCDGHSVALWQQSLPGRLRASIHMPRCASRLTLEVTDVRVDRLQDISEANAIAEGVKQAPQHMRGPYFDPVSAYCEIWTDINGPGSWDANPWVAAYTFRVLPAGAAE